MSFPNTWKSTKGKMVMPDKLDDRIRLVEEHVQAENAHDLDRIMTTFGKQACYEDQPWDEHHQGPGGVQAYYTRLLSALPDLHIAIERRHVTQDDVILEVTITGTHRGEWRGLPATGRRSEEHTSELQSQFHLVCRLLLE